MKVFLAVVLSVIYISQICAIPTTFIQDGTRAEEKGHAVVVLALARIGAHRATFGGGSIISERHILTTAHLCVNAKEFRIGYGDIVARELIRVRAQSALIHSHFNADTLENDLAVITLSAGQAINLRLGKAVPISCRGLFPGDDGIVASFGFNTNSDNTISEKLMVARQVVIDNAPCAATFERAVHRNQFCAQDQEIVEDPDNSDDDDSSNSSSQEVQGNQGQQQNMFNWGRTFARNTPQQLTAVCRGDTGSGLVRTSEGGTILYALVSRVPQGCNSKSPAIYTNVAPFCRWIDDATLGAASTTNA